MIDFGRVTELLLSPSFFTLYYDFLCGFFGPDVGETRHYESCDGCKDQREDRSDQSSHHHVAELVLSYKDPAHGYTHCPQQAQHKEQPVFQPFVCPQSDIETYEASEGVGGMGREEAEFASPSF